MASADPMSAVLAALRTVRGLSRRELAREVGVTERQVGKWETGQQRPTLDRLLAVLAAFDVSLGDFGDLVTGLAGDDRPPRSSLDPMLDEALASLLFAMTEVVSAARALALARASETVRAHGPRP